ncbi:hypothetical protein VTG60DRAFT_4188 [Thermothelomyces hinnuleus]
MKSVAVGAIAPPPHHLESFNLWALPPWNTVAPVFPNRTPRVPTEAVRQLYACYSTRRSLLGNMPSLLHEPCPPQFRTFHSELG